MFPDEWIRLAATLTIVSIVVSASIGILLLATSTDAADLIDDLLTSQDRRKAAEARARGLEKAARRSATQHAFLQTISQVVLGANRELNFVELRRALARQLDALIELKADLFGITPREKYNFCVYVFNPKKNRLECLAKRRGWKDSSDHSPRTWASGKGHVGQSFAGNGEFVYEDCNAPDIKHAQQTSGGLGGPNDKYYVSVAALPILDGGKKPMGLSLQHREPLGGLRRTGTASSKRFATGHVCAEI